MNKEKKDLTVKKETASTKGKNSHKSKPYKALLSACEEIGELFSDYLVYIVIALLSVGLGFFNHFLETHGADAVTVLMLEVCEKGLLAMDILGLWWRAFCKLTGRE